MKQTLRAFSAVALSIFAFTASAQQLSLKLNKGDQYQVVAEAKTAMSIDAMGQTMEINGTSTTSKVIKVNDLAGTNYQVSSAIDKMKMKMDMMGQEMNYDSERNDNDEQLSVIGKIIGKEQKLVVSPQGVVVEKEKADKADDGATEMLASLMGPAGMATNNDFELTIAPLFKQAVEVGKSWQDSSSFSRDKMNISQTGIYEVKEVTATGVKVAYTGTQKLTGKLEQQGMEFDASGNNKITGEYTVDPATGVVTDQLLTIQMNMSMNAMGMEIPTTGTVTTTTKVTKK